YQLPRFGLSQSSVLLLERPLTSCEAKHMISVCCQRVHANNSETVCCPGLVVYFLFPKPSILRVGSTIGESASFSLKLLNMELRLNPARFCVNISLSPLFWFLFVPMPFARPFGRRGRGTPNERSKRWTPSSWPSPRSTS
ncbi:unnamed protein product, partial [Ectocarpus sp. 13 AM-2016]